MSKSFAEAARDLLERIEAGETISITKRTTWDMAFSYYLPEGWRVLKSEATTVVLIWPHEGAPS